MNERILCLECNERYVYEIQNYPFGFKCADCIIDMIASQVIADHTKQSNKSDQS